MSELPTHPDLDQLRRQARERVRAGDAATLSDALHALARDYGYASWPRLKHDIESRPSYVLRYVRTPAELRRLWSALWDFLGEPDADPERRAHWRVFDDFDAQRHRNLVVEDERTGRIAGGALGLHLLAIAPEARRQGLGRRVLEAAEVEAIEDGLVQLHVHADPDSTPFFLHLGYTQRGAPNGRHLYKGVPTSPRLRQRHVERRRAAVGDLDRGVQLTPTLRA